MTPRSLIALSILGVALATVGYAKWSSSRYPLSPLPAVGSPLPSFQFQTVAGNNVSPASLLGAPAVLVLWSTTCPASVQALQGVQQLYADYHNRGVHVLIVADDEEARIRTFADSARLDVPIAVADGRAYLLGDPSARMSLTATMGLPSVLVTDTQGRVVLRTLGVAQHGSPVNGAPFRAIRAALDSMLMARSR